MNPTALPVLPEHLGSCPVCCCLVLVRPFLDRDHSLIVWDPELFGRRWVRAYLTRADIERQGFGLKFGGLHECPPAEECAITRWNARQMEGGAPC
jgi:hypothetical protein